MLGTIASHFWRFTSQPSSQRRMGHQLLGLIGDSFNKRSRAEVSSIAAHSYSKPANYLNPSTISEKSNCGAGITMSTNGRPSRKVVEDSLIILEA